MTTTETRTFETARGHRLSGRLERPGDRDPRGTALFAHCFTCSKDLRSSRAIVRRLAEHGWAVLSFDFTGLGSSDGEFAASTFSSDVDDVRAAATHLADTVAPPALLVGHSIGGAACLAAAADLDDVAAVATIATPADLTHLERHLGDDALRIAREEGHATVTLAGREFTITAAFLDDLADHDLAGRVAELDVATLFLHAPGDRVVGIDQATALFTAARHPKSFVSLDDADHLLSDTADAQWVADVVAAWAGPYVPTRG